MNRLHSNSHSGFSTHRNGNPALAVRRATVVSNSARSLFHHVGPQLGAATRDERNEHKRRSRLDA